MSMLALTQDQLAEFDARIKMDPTGCHLWTGHLQYQGYGRFSLGARKSAAAHRVAYMLAHGEIADGMWIDHICHTRNCVNPEHLRAVTPKQNGENRKGPNQDSRSGLLGVTWHKRDKRWHARVIHAGVMYRLGSFLTSEAANRAVVAKRNELYTHNDRDRIAS